MYNKTTWVDNSSPYIESINMNKIEQGIHDAHLTADANTANIQGIDSRVTVNENSIDVLEAEVSGLLAGEQLQGTWNPELQEYPTAPEIGYSWYVEGITSEPYTFTTGDLISKDVYNHHKMMYGSLGWALITYSTDQNVLKSGDVMTGQLKGITPVAAEDLARKDYVDSVAFAGSTPIGGIIMYNGLLAQIPVNWAICDGLNGTPDLVDRFVLGTATEIEFGTEGGSADSVVAEHTHTQSGHSHTAPSHTHTGAAHTHSIYHNHPNTTTSSGGVHSHSYNKRDSYSQVQFATSNVYGFSGDQGATTSNSSSHTHSLDVAPFSGNSGSASATTTGSSGGTSTSNVTPGINTTGVDGTGTNLPPYVKLGYIQRIS